MKSQSRSKSNTKSQNGTSEKEQFFDNILDIDIGKPKSAFNLYVKEMSLKEENKGKKITDITKMYSDKYKKLTEKEKKKYEDLKEKDKERYENNLRLVKTYLVDPDKLKNTTTAYSLFKDAFVYEEMNEKDHNYEEASKNAREAWDGLSKEEKEEWRQKLKDDQEISKELRHYKPGKVTAYMCYVQHLVNFEGKTLKEAREKWATASNKIREKYEKQALEQNKEKDKLRDLYEIAAGIKPKKPMGAYSIYLSELAASGELGKKNFMVEGAKRWKQLSEDEKEEYHRQHKILSLKYKIKKDHYNKLNNDSRVGKVSGYNLFMKEKSEGLKDKEFKQGEFFALINQEWNLLSQNEKNKYNKMAEEQNKLLGGLDRSELLDEKPSKPSSAYILFMADKMVELKGENAHKNKPQSEIMVLASEAWKHLKNHDKEKYIQRAKDLKEDYEEKMQEYEKNVKDHDTTRGRKSQSKTSEMIQSQISKKSQSKSRLTQTKEKEKEKESIAKEATKSAKIDKDKDKEKDKKSVGKKK